ncbi:hypothetical protein E2C01_018011 [Portunus trituberculatus]|uniref:Uncharacterized protein n=1 Tax=Portunus trituberculatus TaxID=210409 RepID=A0A5B7DVC4_PORTR|nr:hypothetical protein [Portunus trituberculatus]
MRPGKSSECGLMEHPISITLGGLERLLKSVLIYKERDKNGRLSKDALFDLREGGSEAAEALGTSRHPSPATQNKKGEETQAGHANRREKDHLQDDGCLCGSVRERDTSAETESTWPL